MRIRFLLLMLTAYFGLGSDVVRSDTPNQKHVGLKLESFSLQDYRGREWSQADFSDKKILVVAFLGTECPLVKLYSPRLQQLADKFDSDGVAFVGVNANRHDSVTEIAAHARRHGVKFPILKDVGNRLADKLHAARTPEVFVLDESRVVRYFGRIDDQYGVGYIRDEPKRNDLETAIRELVAGKKVSLAETESVGCHIGRIKEPKANSQVTYSNQIARIFQRRCVECHREGEIAPFELTEYDEVVGWAEMVGEVVDEGRMPPWHADAKHGKFVNDRHLTADEKSQILQWVRDGAPEGDPSQLPKPQTYVTGWQLPKKPDLVLNCSPEPFRVQAEGDVRYQYFKVDPKLTEDKWIQAAELKPGNRAVVHHILAFSRTPGTRDRSGGGANGFLVAYVPGMRAAEYPAGMAKKIPAGSELIFQMHYTPVGTEQFDQSQLGIVFADPKSLKHEVITTSAVGRRLSIPPHAANHEISASSARAQSDVMLLGMMPHMHLRGKAFRYDAVFPSGKRETLLNIPQYDFNWQTSYRLVEPLAFPSGSRMECVAHFDNSEDNLNNPDPTITVRWGEQTWNEMMIGYFDIAIPFTPEAAGDGTKPAGNRPPKPGDQLRAKLILKRFDSSKNGTIEKSEVPQRLQRLFKRIDANSDDKLTEAELIKAIDLLK